MKQPDLIDRPPSDAASEQRDVTFEYRDSVADERDTAADERDDAAARRDAVADERDGAARRRDAVADERDGAAGQRDDAADERDSTAGRRHVIAESHDGAPDPLGDSQSAAVRRDRVGLERDAAAESRDVATLARDKAELNRGAAAGARSSAAVDRASAASSRVLDVKRFATAEDAVEFAATVLEASTEYAMVAVDSDSRILLWNEGARRLYGYERGDIVGELLSVLHTEDDVAAGLPREMASLVLRDGVWAGLVEQRRKNGSQFTARAVKTSRRGAVGEASGFLMISSDVTDEVRLSRELERTQQFSEALVESAPDAMVIVRDDGAIQFVNAALERLLGYDRAELVGQPVEVLIPARHRSVHPGHRGGFFKTPHARSMGADLNLTGLRKDGVEVPVEISLSPLETDERTLVTAAIRDVSERIRNEQELRDANVRLESASRAKDRFLANMSHELRTPLNAILGFTGTMLMELPGPLNEVQFKQLRTVQSSGKHLLSLINDLLDLARIESGKVELHIEPIMGSELLDEIASSLRPLADAKGIGLEVMVEAGLTVNSDRRALRQILINLANNAIKFTDDGRVLLQMSHVEGRGGSQARFSVIDTGSGIKAADQTKLFDAFEQVTGSGERPYEGTGLGLYICRTLAGVLGASISFQSKTGHGSTFVLELAD